MGYRKEKHLCEQNQESREGTKDLGEWTKGPFLGSTDGPWSEHPLPSDIGQQTISDGLDFRIMCSELANSVSFDSLY